MSRLKKEDYLTENTKQLESEFKEKVKEDREKALAKRLVEKIPAHRRQFVLDELSKDLAAKG